MADADTPLRSTFSMRTGVAHLRTLAPVVLLDLALQNAGPDVLVSPILHEVIHHACANTAVNVALQYRWLELLRGLLSSPSFGYGLDEELVALAADLAATEAILQPVAEGLAHFAEFDCVVPESAILRSTMLGPADALTWRLLSFKAGVGSHVDELWGQLRTEQLSQRTVSRKTDLLCTPVRPATGNDSYLLGYLAVKTLWNRFLAGRPEARLRAPSFLNFAMYYLYEDWALARLLLAPGPIAVNAVAERVTARLTALFRADLPALVAAFTDDMASRSQDRGTLQRGPEERQHGGFRGLDLTTAEIRAGMASLVRFHAERVGPGGALADQRPRAMGIRNQSHAAMMTVMDSAAPFVTELLHHHHVTGAPAVRLLDFVLDIPQRKRAFCYLMDVPVDVRADGTRLLLSPAGDLTTVRALPAAAAGQFSAMPQAGRLVGVITSTAIPWRFYGFLVKENAVVCSWEHGGTRDDTAERQALMATISREVSMEASTRLSFVTLNDYITRNAEAAERLRRRADEATQVAAAALQPLLGAAGWQDLLSTSRAQDFGMRNLVGKTSDVRCLAIAGLSNAFHREREPLDALMRANGTSLASAVEIAGRVQRAAGVTLIRTEGDQVFVQV
jgi:hypothetical protein